MIYTHTYTSRRYSYVNSKKIAAMGILCACLPVCWPLIARRASVRALHSNIYSKSYWTAWIRQHKTSLRRSRASDRKQASQSCSRDDQLDIEALPLDEYCLPPSPEDTQLQLLPLSNAHIRVDRSIQVDVEYTEQVRTNGSRDDGDRSQPLLATLC